MKTASTSAASDCGGTRAGPWNFFIQYARRAYGVPGVWDTAPIGAVTAIRAAEDSAARQLVEKSVFDKLLTILQL